MKLISTKKNYQLNPAAVDTVSEDVGQFLGRLKASKKITVETRFTVEENLLKLMEKYGSEKEFCYIESDFLGRPYFSISFEGEQYIDDIVKKAAIICYTRILRWHATKKSKDDELAQKYIEYSKNYIIENVPQVDSLYF